jgi:hypothetical protein
VLEPQFDPASMPPIPQAYLDRLRAGFELQNQVTPNIPPFEQGRFADAFEVAARRVRQAAGITIVIEGGATAKVLPPVIEHGPEPPHHWPSVD